MTSPGLDPLPPPTGRHPHEILLASVCIALGIAGIFVPVSPALAVAFPGWTATAFYVGLTVSGAVTLSGIFNTRIEGPLIERIGLGVMTLWLMAYALVAITVSGNMGMFAASFPIGFAVANCVRIYQIQGALRRWKGSASKTLRT